MKTQTKFCQSNTNNTYKYHKSPRRGLVAFALALVGVFSLLGISSAVQAVESEEFHYHYIPLSDIKLPLGFSDFTPSAIDDKGRIYGSVFDAFFTSHIAVYANGAITVLQPGNIFSVNARGTVGGFITDPESFNNQAALFRGKSVELIPFLPGETSTIVLSVNDSDTALVRSDVPPGSGLGIIYRLYSKGKYIFNFQVPTRSDRPSSWGVNNRGEVVGTIFDPGLRAFRAIRFQPPYRNSQLLNPLPSDNASNSFGINKPGNILGVSEVFPNGIRHYGIWDKKGNFKTYSEESISFNPIFNNKNLIVLTGADNEEAFNAYLVPKPGVRLNVLDLLDNPAEASVRGGFRNVADINNRGDMVGSTFDADFNISSFLIRRVLLED